MALFPENGDSSAPVHTQSVFHALTDGIWAKKERRRKPAQDQDQLDDRDPQAKKDRGGW